MGEPASGWMEERSLRNWRTVSPTPIGGEAQLPFGGCKATGYGDREMADDGLNFFTQTKTVFVNYSGRGERAMIRSSEFRRGAAHPAGIPSLSPGLGPSALPRGAASGSRAEPRFEGVTPFLQIFSFGIWLLGQCCRRRMSVSPKNRSRSGDSPPGHGRR